MTKAKLSKKAPPPEEVINVGPCSPRQERAFSLAQEVDFLLIGGSRGK